MSNMHSNHSKNLAEVNSKQCFHYLKIKIHLLKTKADVSFCLRYNQDVDSFLYLNIGHLK